MDLKSKAIGILGGSYDPPHAGHLALARAAQAQLGLNQLRLMPNARPWQKVEVTPAKHRVQMLKLALQDMPNLVLDQTEIERGDASYTVDTLSALRAQSGKDIPLIWIMGSDQFAQLHTWHRWDQILNLAHIAVAHRAGQAHTLSDPVQALYQAHRANANEALQKSCGHIIDIDMPAVEVSATRLRQLLARTSSTLTESEQGFLSHALDPNVLEYIHTNHLYLSQT